MNWLARLKSEMSPDDHASKPRKPGFLGSLASPDRGDGGFLGSLAPMSEHFQISPQPPAPAANDPIGRPAWGGRSGVEGASTAPIPSVPRTRARGELVPPDHNKTLTFASETAPSDMPCPMSTVEIERFMARMEHFTNRGLGLARAESLADQLVLRDREGDDRRVCVECSRHCTGTRSCGRARVAGLGHPELGELAFRLQRCHAFAPAISNTEGATP